MTYNINGGSEANINVNANSTSPLTISTSTVGAFTYNIVSVSYQTAPSCPNNAVTGSATVTVNPLPVVDAGVNQTIPFGTSTTLNATVTGTGLTYIWTPAASLVNATVVDPTTVNLNTTTIFTLTATTSAGCSASYQVTVNVSGSALGSAASATPSRLCAGACG